MSILIKGAELPQNCGECPCEQEEYGYCQVFDGTHFCEYESRPEWCPLVEIKTPHGRLIDGDALYHEMAKHSTAWEYGEGVEDCISDLENAPTVIEAEE